MNIKDLARYTTLILVSAACLSGAPRLGLSTTTVGPVNIAQGANGPVETVQATNLGDGSLSLTATASVSWLSVKVEPATSCQSGHCVPVAISLNTSSLKTGTYTGIVTVSDPAATDAPQTITVTVSIGGQVPSKLDLYAAPGGSATATFNTDHPVNSAVSTQTGGEWLTLRLTGQGTFTFSVPYAIKATALPGLTGNYTGAVKLSGSASSLDNKTVAVTLHVTTEPIIDLANASLTFTVGQGMAAQSQYVNTSNDGQGTLTIADTKVTMDTGTWLSAKPIAGTPLVQVTADPTGLGPGTHTGTVTIDSNAANGSLDVPVQLDVVAEAPPLIQVPGVLNPGNYLVGEALAQGDIALVKGTWLHNGDPVSATTKPLPTELGSDNVKVLVNGVAAPLYYVSFGQVNFQIPYETPVGAAAVQVVANGKTSNTETVQIAASVPRILQFCYASNFCPAVWGIGVTYADNTFPIDSTAQVITDRGKRAATAGTDVIQFYAIGLGQTTPAQTTGAAPTSGVVNPKYLVCFETDALSQNPVCVKASYAGVAPGYVGLYQVNVHVPANAPKGDQVMVYIANGPSTSDPVAISIQ